MRYGGEPRDHQLAVLTGKVTRFLRSSAGRPFFAAFTPTVNRAGEPALARQQSALAARLAREEQAAGAD